MSKNKDTKNFFTTPLFYVVSLTFLISISTPCLNIYYDYLDDGIVTQESFQALFAIVGGTSLGVLEILRERFKINDEYLSLMNMAMNKDELRNELKKGKKLLSTPSGLPGRTNFDA